MSSSASAFPIASGPGSVSGVPELPSGFAETFTSRYVDTGDLRQHVVIGGDGPPLLLMHGWQQTWYAWRLVMPALANQYEVIAPDQRGTGLSGKPETAYDRLWHFAFNRLAALSEEMVVGREDVYFGWQFESKAAHPLPESMHRFYVDTVAASRDALHGCFGMYRALDETAAQNVQRKNTRLTLPVLAMGGAASLGDMVADTMKLGADNVETAVIPDCGHWVAEEAPDALVAALTAFFAAYREQRVAAQAGAAS